MNNTLLATVSAVVLVAGIILMCQTTDGLLGMVLIIGATAGLTWSILKAGITD